MKQQKKYTWGWLAAALLLGGCSAENDLPADRFDRFGQIAVAGQTSAEVETRAGTDLNKICKNFDLPKPEQLRLTISGEDIAEIIPDLDGNMEVISYFDYNQSWPSLAQYDQPALFPGSYDVALSYGDPEAVGPNKPYFEGFGSAEVSINHVTTCAVRVRVANAVLRIALSDGFADYFTQPAFRLVVDGEETDYVLTAAAGEEPIFVPAGAQVALRGTVRRPSQTTPDDADGELMEVEVPARSVEAGMLYTFRFTAESGGLQIEVRFGDAEDHVTFPDFEMNPDVNGDADKNKPAEGETPGDGEGDGDDETSGGKAGSADDDTNE